MLKCEICGKEVYLMVGHLRKHNISWEEYKSDFPNAKNMSPEVSEKQSIRNIGNSYKLGCKESEETKLKKSKAHLGLPSKLLGCKRPAEIGQKQSIRLLGNKYRLGTKQTEETKMKIGEKSRGRKYPNRVLSEQHKLSIKNAMNNMPEGELSRLIKNGLSNDATRHKMKESRRAWLDSNGGHLPIEHRENARKALIERSKNPEYRKRLSDGKKKLWLRAGYRERCVSAVMKALQIKPNKQESKLQSLLGLFWRYTGDGGLIIAGKVPDFWNGDHKLVELFGDYWHRGENPQDRIDIFEKNGYKCLVIWEHELKNIQDVKQKIVNYELSTGVA